MPSPGDLLTLDYQWQLQENLYGHNSNNVSYQYGHTIEGLGVPDAKTQDVVYNMGPGSYANPDYLGMRLVTIPAIVRATPAVTAGAAAKALAAIWVPSLTDVDLSFQLPGFGKFTMNGRPRGAKMDLTDLDKGAVYVLLRFDCPDPTITFL